MLLLCISQWVGASFPISGLPTCTDRKWGPRGAWECERESRAEQKRAFTFCCWTHRDKFNVERKQRDRDWDMNQNQQHLLNLHLEFKTIFNLNIHFKFVSSLVKAFWLNWDDLSPQSFNWRFFLKKWYYRHCYMFTAVWDCWCDQKNCS